MFENLYNQINENLTNFKCNGCNIYNNTNSICPDLDIMYTPGHNEQYDCNRKAISFVNKYGAAYISEIYHYLETSNILHEYNNRTLHVLTLGSGFDPWYYAITKYIEDYNLDIEINYTGYDESINWNVVRPNYINVNHICIDLTQQLQIDLNNYDFIIVDKMFSTIRKTSTPNEEHIFLNNIVQGFNNITTNKKHTLIFREQAKANDIYSFDNFISNSNINWKNIHYFYLKGRDTAHIKNIINFYELRGVCIDEISNKDLIYNKRYNNGCSRLYFNSFFIQYSI